jgi:co-chaperonin GroES (HSP10)
MNRAEIAGMTFRPALNRVRVRVLDVEETSKGGIIMHTTAGQRREQMGCDVGILEAIGPDAWAEFDDKSFQIGDLVIFAQYGGKSVPETDNKIRILNDIDIIAVAEKNNGD